MAFHVLYPEVAGGLGAETDLDTSVHPPIVHKLHYEVAGWLGDDLLESFPVFLASPRLITAISDAGLTGTTTRPALVTLLPGTEELIDPAVLDFQWLYVTGEPGQDDLGLDETARLVVSDRALDVMRTQGQLDNCEVEPHPAE
jgi:hypothetical protein